MKDRDHSIMPIKIGLNRSEASAHIGISAPTFDRLVALGLMPKPIKIFTRSVWDRRAVEAAFWQLGNTPSEEDEADKWLV